MLDRSRGEGSIVRRRACDSPRPSPFGRHCQGRNYQKRRCNIFPCNSHGKLLHHPFITSLYSTSFSLTGLNIYRISYSFTIFSNNRIFRPSRAVPVLDVVEWVDPVFQDLWCRTRRHGGEGVGEGDKHAVTAGGVIRLTSEHVIQECLVSSAIHGFSFYIFLFRFQVQ